MGKIAQRDIDLYRGDDYTHVLNFVDNSDPPETLDLSELTFTAQIRDRSDEGTVVYAEFDIDTTQASVGVLVLRLTGAQTRIKPGYWDLQVDDGEKIKTWLKGAVTVDGDVTRGVGE